MLGGTLTSKLGFGTLREMGQSGSCYMREYALLFICRPPHKVEKQYKRYWKHILKIAVISSMHTQRMARNLIVYATLHVVNFFTFNSIE